MQPARQRQSVVDKEGVQAEADDVDGDGDQEHVDRLDQSDGEGFGGFGRHRSLPGDLDHRLGNNERLVHEKRERSDET